MTEKRFKLKKIFDVDENLCLCDNGQPLCEIVANKEEKAILLEVLNALHEEKEHYKSIFFELVETALTDKNCRELYCKGILDIFDKANSLNQARDMIKEHLND